MNPKDPRNFLRLLEKNMLEQFYPEKIGFRKDRTTKSAAIGEVSVFLRKLWSERNKLSNFSRVGICDIAGPPAAPMQLTESLLYASLKRQGRGKAIF